MRASPAPPLNGLLAYAAKRALDLEQAKSDLRRVASAPGIYERAVALAEQRYRESPGPMFTILDAYGEAYNRLSAGEEIGDDGKWRRPAS